MRRILAVAIVVVVNAAVQAAIVGVAPRDPFSAGGILLAVVSLFVLFAAAVVIARHVLWTVIGGLLVVLAALVLPYAVPVVVALAAVVAIAGSPRGAFALLRRHPVRTILLLVLTAVVVVLGWAAALLFGLLFGGVPGSAATWLVAGALAGIVAWAWARSSRQAPGASAVVPE